jgi:transcriptional regulator with XRE-family HTH domain
VPSKAIHEKDLQAAHKKLGLDTLDFDRVIVGQLLKSARDSLGKRLKDIEAGAGITASHIWNIEKGKKDVSIERLVRLACFYGFPPGLLLEAGLKVRHEPIWTATRENAARIMKEWGWRKSEDRAMIVAELAAALAVILTHLLRSTRPGFLVELFDFPSFELKHRFRLIAYHIETRVPPSERMMLLQHVPLLPEHPLKMFGLLKPEDVEWYEKIIKIEMLGFTRPWVPLPRGTLADFKKAVDLPPHSKEERDFLNSLRDAAEATAARG